MALDLEDKSGNGNDLTNSGIAEETSEIPSGLSDSTVSANLITGESDYASITDAAQTGLNFSTTFTLESWIYLKTNSPGRYIIVGKADKNSATERAYLACIRSGNLICIWVQNGEVYDYYRYTTAVPTGEWHHWAITCDTDNPSATTFEFFKDGSSVGNGAAYQSGNIATIYDTNTDFTLGCWVNGAGHVDYADFYMDDVRLWNDVRTGAEIAANYQSHLVGNEAGLVAYWPFEALGAAGTRRFYSPGIWRAV